MVVILARKEYRCTHIYIYGYIYIYLFIMYTHYNICRIMWPFSRFGTHASRDSFEEDYSFRAILLSALGASCINSHLSALFGSPLGVELVQ